MYNFQNMTKLLPLKKERKQRPEVTGTSEKTCILHIFKVSLMYFQFMYVMFEFQFDISSAISFCYTVKEK